MKSDYLERRIKLNRDTTVIIRSKKAKNSEIFENTITVVYQTADIQPLQFATRQELEAAIKEIDLTEPQLNLFNENITVPSTPPVRWPNKEEAKVG